MTPSIVTPFYDPALSYADNYSQGPFGAFADSQCVERTGSPRGELFGHLLQQPFGIPAGPLLNSAFTTAAFAKGFDVCVYKTVRTREYACHPWPNVLAVHPVGELHSTEAEAGLVADTHYTQPLSITNSFGVPSMAPEVWQADMQQALQGQGKQQLLIGSFQGTSDGSGDVAKYIADFSLAAQLVKETGVRVLEANLSCPNEGTAHLLCFDIERTQAIVMAIKAAIGDTPLIIKIAHFADQAALEKFVTQVGPLVDGIASINTIPARIVTPTGEPALPGKGRERSGVCGATIKWAGLDMVKRLCDLREQHHLNYVVIGGGGVTTPADYQAYREAGAALVMSATGAMWNPYLAQEIYNRSEETVV